MGEYAALPKTPHALADSLILVFQHPGKQAGNDIFTDDLQIQPARPGTG
jgi:hypothetical protein